MAIELKNLKVFLAINIIFPPSWNYILINHTQGVDCFIPKWEVILMLNL
jgi:hypothetical protein